MSALSPRARLSSISFAITGIFTLVQTQANARIHLAATVAVIALGMLLPLERWEWTSLALAIAVVWTAEALNTAIECLGDAVTREINPSIKAAKDVAAGGVLVSAIGAAVVGALVFLPHIWLMLAP